MPVIIRPGFTRQPQSQTGIWRANPLTAGLVDWQAPGAVGGLFNSGATVAPTKGGVAYQGNGSSTYFYKNSAPVGLSKSSNYTILAIVMGSVGADARVYSFGNSADPNPILCIGSGGTTASKLRLWYRDSAGNNSSADSTAVAFEAGVPHVAVLRVSGTTVSAFIDGRFDSSTTATGNIGVGAVDRTAVGCLLRSSAASFSGAALTLGLTWNRALSDAEIAAVSANPWQVFAPSAPLFPAFAVGGGGPTYTLALDSGSFALTGTAAALAAARKLVAASGSFTLTGQSVAFKAGRKIAAASGSFALTGGAVGLPAQRRLAAGSGSFSLAGQDVSFSYGTSSPTYTITMGSGSFALAGTSLAFKAGRKLTAASGSYLLNGQSVTFTYSGARAPLKPIRKTQYVPTGNVPGDVAGIQRYLQLELERVNNGLESPFTHDSYEVLHVEPGKKQADRVYMVFADGTDWDPGSGRGFYYYDNGTWTFLG